jgi:hypothetical protein
LAVGNLRAVVDVVEVVVFPDFGPQLFDSLFGVVGHNGINLYAVLVLFARGQLSACREVKVGDKIADISELNGCEESYEAENSFIGGAGNRRGVCD